MRRTVKEARTPSPRLRMTTPSNACSRSFSPSMTFTCTRTVSPGAKLLRSFLSCPASTSRMASMTSSLSRSLLGRVAPLEPFYQLALLGGEGRPLQQLRPRPPRAVQRLRPPPARDARVIAREQHRRHPRAAELLGARVLRRLQQAVGERLALGRALASEHAGEPAHHRVRHDERRRSEEHTSELQSRLHLVCRLLLEKKK